MAKPMLWQVLLIVLIEYVDEFSVSVKPVQQSLQFAVSLSSSKDQKF